MPKPKPPAPAKKKVEPVSLEKEELFAYAYVKHFGNGAAAAREVYGLDGSPAYVCASKMLRKAKVQQIVTEYLDKQRETFRNFADQHSFYLTRIAEEFLRIAGDKEVSAPHRMSALRQLARLANVELGESVATAAATAKGMAARQAALPGSNQGGGNIDSRQTIFMLSPPPIPPGGVVPPALAEQWKALGWKPGIATEPIVVDN